MIIGLLITAMKFSFVCACLRRQRCKWI